MAVIDIEIGTVTPLAQKGNAKPRIFRLSSDNALINRLGFNNKGVKYVVHRLKKVTKNPEPLLGRYSHRFKHGIKKHCT